MNLADMLAHQARRRPHHPAIIEGERTIPYRELDSLVRRTAAHLLDLGAGPGDVVGLALGDTAQHLVAHYAVARMGGVILPVDRRWSAEEKDRVTTFFGATLTLVEPGESAPDSVAVDDGWGAATSRADGERMFATGADAPVVLSLSSGTTGRPKGPALTHRQFLARWITQFVTLTFSEHDRYLSATPLYFGGGRSFTMSALYAGATVVMFPPPYAPEALAAAVAESRATTTLLVPTMLRRLLDIPGRAAPRLGGLRLLLSTGAILHADERAKVMSDLCPRFVNYYGSTEGGGVSVLMPYHPAEKSGSVGTIVFGTDVEIVDEEHAPLPTDERGRIRYRGPGVADGFFRDPAATAESFRDGWFYPGDLGRIDGDGFLHLAGRSDDIVIRGGINLYPAEIEQVLLSHPAVRDAAVVGWPSREFGEEVAAFVVADGNADTDAILAYCRRHLAPYKVPRSVFVLDALPRSALGKVRRDALQDRLRSL